jgi:hypothetical protein
VVRVRGRRGRGKWNSTPLPSASDVLTLHRLYPRVGSPATLAAYQTTGGVVNFRHDTADNGTFAAVTGAFNAASGQAWRFVNWPQKEASFGVNGVNGLYAYNGTLAPVTITGVAVDGPYMALWKNRLWATKKAELPFSVYASDLFTADHWTGTQQLSLNDATGNNITGISPDPTGDYLVMAKQQSLWHFWGDIALGDGGLRKFSDQGCIAPDTLALTDWGVLYVGRQGVYLNSGSQSVGLEISAPIRGLFKTTTGDNVYPDAVGAWYKRRQQYWLKLAPTDPDTYILQRVAVYNATTGQESGAVWLWSKFTAMPFRSAAGWDGANDDARLLVGDRMGQVWQVDTGNTDNALPYVLYIRSHRLLLDAAERRVGRVAGAEISYLGNNPVTVAVTYDESAGADATLVLGASQADSSLQRSWQPEHSYDVSGQFYTWLLTFIGDNPNFQLRRLDVVLYYRAAKVWR